MTKFVFAAVATVLAAASCARPSLDDAASPLAPTAAGANQVGSAGMKPEREVGDIGGGGAECVEPDAILCEQRYAIVAGNGDMVSGLCVGDCKVFEGTGRFAGAIPIVHGVTPGGEPARFGFYVPNPPESVVVSLLLRLPKLGDNVFWMNGVVDASRHDSSDSICPHGIRINLDLAGVIEGLGKSSGSLSYCAP